MRKKEYQNGDLTIVWESSLCSHAGVCVRSLPNVYDPKARPWIKAENASIEELKSQINKCPSGALSFYMNNEENKEPQAVQTTKVEVIPNGPLRVHGSLEVTDSEGNVVVRNTPATTFCRCGATANGPFCDGSHRKIEWKG